MALWIPVSATQPFEILRPPSSREEMSSLFGGEYAQLTNYPESGGSWWGGVGTEDVRRVRVNVRVSRYPGAPRQLLGPALWMSPEETAEFVRATQS